MVFKKGVFVTYVARTKFHLGEKAIDILEGDEIEFDGSTLRYNGDEFSVPSLRGAILRGWLVEPDQNIEQYLPEAAGIQVHKAQASGRDRGAPTIQMGAIQEEEQEVGAVSDHRQRIKDALTPNPARKVASRPKPVAPPPEESPPIEDLDLADVDFSGAEFSDDASEETSEKKADDSVSDGGKAPSPGVGKALLEKAQAAEEINLARIRAALEVDVGPADRQSYGGRRYDSLEENKAQGKKFGVAMVPENQGEVVVGKIQTKLPGLRVGESDESGAPARTTSFDVTKVTAKDIENSIKPVGGRKKPEPPRLATARNVVQDQKAGAIVIPEESLEEASFQIPLKRGTATQITEGESLSDHPAGTSGDVTRTIEGDDLADLLPDAAVAGLQKTEPPRTEGFQWDMSAHWTHRVNSAIADFGDKPEALERIYEIETPKVVQRIRSGLLQAGKTTEAKTIEPS